MLRITLWLLVGVCGFASCNNICPDGNVLSDLSTCCMTTDGYRACPYPNAVCCSNLEHCCPSGFQCNLGTQMCEKVNQPWMNIPMVKKEASEKPSTLLLPFSPLQEPKNNLDQKQRSDHVCEHDLKCRVGQTCCRGKGNNAYFCCRHRSATCCADRKNCCPYGTICDYDGKCVRRGLRYPFSPEQALSSVPASLISTSEDKDNLQEEPKNNLDQKQRSDHVCEHDLKCRVGQTCCRGEGNNAYFCCRHRSATCCADRKNCCPYGTICDYDGKCVRRGLRYPFSPEQALSSVPASLISTSEDKDNLQEEPKNNLDQKQRSDHLCGHDLRCSVGHTCCRDREINTYFCCPFRAATCCANRSNCCPNGTFCAHDGQCVRRGLRYPFSPIQALSSVPASLISTSEDKDNPQEDQ